MKVYVWFEVVEYDYEGSDNQNRGVFATKEAALREIKKLLPDADENFNGEEWHLPYNHPERRGDTHYWEVVPWEVQD